MELKIPVGVQTEVIIPPEVGNYILDENNYEIEDKKGSIVKLVSGEYNVAYNKM